MKFWRDNRADQGFDMPVAQVAKAFLDAAEDSKLAGGELAQMLSGMPLERVLRHWLTSSDWFSSVWEDENRAIFGEESFDGLYDLVYDGLYKTR